jgi:hypothetical protein
MCVVSMVGDHYQDKWQDLPGIASWPLHPQPEISRQEFDQLKRDVEEMKALLQRAKKYDEENGEPDCEIEEKMALLRKVARMVGVDLDDVIATQH